MKTIVRENINFWSVYVPRAWERTRLDEKLAWMVGITYTLCLISLIEILLLK